MASFESGRWIIGILVFCFVIVIVISLLLNGKAEITGTYDNGVTFYDPGFMTTNDFYFMSPYCTGKSDKLSFNGDIKCHNFVFARNESDLCTNLSGCFWVDDVSILSLIVFDAHCEGVVNVTNMSINSTDNIEICKSGYFTSQEKCELFGCTWIGTADQDAAYRDVMKSKNSVSRIWDTIKWLAFFKIDIGLGAYNWIISLVFWIVLVIGLSWALYMALPFL